MLGLNYYVMPYLSAAMNWTPISTLAQARTHSGFLTAEGRPQNVARPSQRSHPKIYQSSAKDTIEYTALRDQKTQVQSLMGGGQIFEKVENMIQEAEKSDRKPWIFMNLYELQSPGLYAERKCPPNTPGQATQASIAERMIRLHKEGKAQIRVILDNSKQQPREMEKGKPKILMEPKHNDRTLKALRDNGVPVLPYPNSAALKNHVKLFIMDNKAIVGGMNWGNHSAANHDACVYVEGPEVKNFFTKVFKPDWETSLDALQNSEGPDPTGSSIPSQTHLPSIQPFPQGKIKVLQTSGKRTVQGPKDEILGEILNQIHQAKDSVQAQLFVLTHKKVVDALIQKHRELKQNGKKGVQILVDEGLYQVFPNCRKGIQRLDDAGVPIRFLKTDREREEKLHSKWAVFDEKKLLIGSANWSSLGLDSRDGGSKDPLENEEAVWLAEAEEGTASIVPYKTNHEIAVVIEDAPNVAKTFSRQADSDFTYVRGQQPQKSIPVCFKKQDRAKSWANQPERPSLKRKPDGSPDLGVGPTLKRPRLELA